MNSGNGAVLCLCMYHCIHINWRATGRYSNNTHNAFLRVRNPLEAEHAFHRTTALSYGIHSPNQLFCCYGKVSSCANCCKENRTSKRSPSQNLPPLEKHSRV